MKTFFVQTFCGANQDFCSKFYCAKSQAFVQLLCVKIDFCSHFVVFNLLECNARLLFNISGPRQDFCSSLVIQSKFCVQTFWALSMKFVKENIDANEDFCSNVCGAKGDFCWKFWSGIKDFWSNIFGVRQDFCSYI